MKSALATLAAVVLAGCATTPFDTAVATAKLDPTRGNATAGTVPFAERGGKVPVTAAVRKTMGVVRVASCERISVAISPPSLPGIMTSNNTRWGRNCCAARAASSG